MYYCYNFTSYNIPACPLNFIMLRLPKCHYLKWKSFIRHSTNFSRLYITYLGCGEEMRHTWIVPAHPPFQVWSPLSLASYLPDSDLPPSPIPPFPLDHQSAWEGSLLYSSLSPAIYFTHGSVYMSRLLSPLIPLSPSQPVPTSLFSVSASPFLPSKKVHQYRFSRFHICVNIHCFSLSDLLQSV